MDRRSTIAKIFGKNTQSETAAAPAMPGGSLAPYTGPWTVKEASHLMRRATFAPSKDMIEESLQLGMSSSVNRLMTNEVTPPAPPIKWNLDQPHPNPLLRPFIPYVDDPMVKYGETWVNAKILPQTGDPVRDQAINIYRLLSMYSWMFNLINKDNFSIREKMSIFWHNHFVVSDFAVPKLTYQYMSTIHDHLLGDFRQLTKDMTVDPSMLLYLNGAENNKDAPNENFARELLELFTVGKGDLAGPGDYTTFTEDDVREIAKALTGWSLPFDLVLQNPVDVDSVYYFFWHDFTTKNLSHRFNNAVIQNNGENEYKDVVDAIFQSPHVGLFMARKLYRYFVHYDINAEVETSVIEPLAQIIRDNDYVMGPAVEALLSSEHFFSDESIGCMIKNPIDFYHSLIKGFGVQFDGNTSFLENLDQLIDGPILDAYNAIVMYQMSSASEMDVFNHPNVAGWKAYYQNPTFYRTWINTATLPVRITHSTALINGQETTVGEEDYDFSKVLPVIDIVATIQDAHDPNKLIFNIADRIFPYGVPEEQKDFLKQVLIPGLPDFEWTVEYNDFLADPNDPAKRLAIDNRLRALFTAMYNLPEAQLM